MDLNSIKTKIDLDIKNFFAGNHDLTFLIGAGCSVDSPSCLPAGRPMMDAIIEYVCPSEDVEKIKSLSKSMRFEQLIELFRDNLDSDLKVIDYYGSCAFQNIQHFFLANMINRGHYVITTNFDYLIERALLTSVDDKSIVTPVITEGDFQSYKDPKQIINMGKKPVYKIHGSPKNIITDEQTKDSLVATIQAFGKNKEGLNVFQIEPFKRELFDNISNKRSLVVMDYSGSDDFDIVPTLKVLKNLKSIFWLNYVREDNNKEEVYEIKAREITDQIEGNQLDKVDQILSEIKNLNSDTEVYRIDTNTSRFIEDILTIKPDLNNEEFSTTPSLWLKQIFPELDEENKVWFANRLYYDLHDYKNALKCSEKLLQIAEQKDSKGWISKALSSIGMINYSNGNQEVAMQNYERSLEISKELEDKNQIIYLQRSIGLIFRDNAKYNEAMEYFQKVIEIEDEIGDRGSKGSDLANIGMCYMGLRDYEKALEYNERAIKIFDETGNLLQKGRILSDISWVYRELQDYEKSLKYSKEGLKILEQIGDNYGVGSILMDIGLVNYDLGKYNQALDNFKKAYDILDRLGHTAWKASCLTHLGGTYYYLKDYDNSVKHLKEALEIQDRLNLQDWKAETLSRLGETLSSLKNYQEAIESLESAIQILEQIGQGNSPRAVNFRSILQILKNKS
jgi:tetratricopeptide (TPR) repeat protein